MRARIAAALLTALFLFVKVTEPRALDDDTAEKCTACDRGKQDACDALVRLDKAHGVNVCDVRDYHAPREEYNARHVEGDILLPDPSGRAALRYNAARWEGGVVPYQFDEYFSNTELATIRAAMEHLEEKTCIRFKKRTNEKSWVEITNRGGGCYSMLGRLGGRQTLNLAAGCLYSIGTPVHEMLHALGFIHEQNRPDRDSYITINWDNIKPRMDSQFRKSTTDDVSTSNTKYDYGSVMHYASWGFAIDTAVPVLTPKQTGADIGQRKGLSPTDIIEVNAIYGNCKAGTATDKPVGTKRPQQGSKTTTTPKPNWCVDSTSACPGWKKYCEQADHVPRMCPKTCGAC